MYNHKVRQTGFTLLEIILVLAIGAALVVVSLKQYNAFQRGAEVAQVQGDVDQLFYAAAKYYRAQCAAGGALDPATNVALQSSNAIKALDINKDLIKGGYLNSMPNINPMIDSSSVGYAVQLNKTDMDRTITVCQNEDCTSTTTMQIGTVVIWSIQVSVHINQSYIDINNVLNILGASCTQGTGGGSPLQVQKCSTGASGSYLVFERMPSDVLSDLDAQSPYWMLMPTVKIFNQEYTTAPLSELLSRSHTPEFQYFYCTS